MYLGEICIAFLFLLFAYFVWAKRKYSNQFFIFEKKENIFRFFSVGVLHFLKICRQRFQWRVKGNRLEQLKKIYVGRGEEEIFYRYYGKFGCVLMTVMIAGLVFISIGGLITQRSRLVEGYFLTKDGVLGTDDSIQLEAKVDGEEHDVTVQIPKEEYSKAELEEKFSEAFDYIDHTYLGENHSPQKVTESLNLIDSIPDSAISIMWNLGNDGLVQTDGSIANEELEKSQQTQITAVLSYGDIEKSVVKMLTILPVQRTREELFWKKWQKQVETNAIDSASEQYLNLPRKIEGKEIAYQEKKTPVSYTILVLFLFFMILIPVLAENEIRKRVVQRDDELRAEYPDFVEHFVLLIGAGLNIKGAWERIVHDYQKEQGGKGRKYVYEEMIVTMREIENGMSEARAYELFGKRTGLLQYMKFCTLIVQNLRKGTEDLLKLLDYEVADAFRERKENAKTLGEKAGTKLLLPMMLMLLIVFVLILYAAFHSM